jgi:hypothetical protein
MMMVMPEPDRVVMAQMDRQVMDRRVMDRQGCARLTHVDGAGNPQTAESQAIFQSLYGTCGQCLEAPHLCLPYRNRDS